jgi:hypothetical protein
MCRDEKGFKKSNNSIFGMRKYDIFYIVHVTYTSSRICLHKRFKENKKIKYLRVSGFRDEKTSILRSLGPCRLVERENRNFVLKTRGVLEFFFFFFFGENVRKYES